MLTQEEKELICVSLANSVHDPEQVDIHGDCFRLYHRLQTEWNVPELPDMDGREVSVLKD